MSREHLFALAARDLAEMLYADSRVPVMESLGWIWKGLLADDRLPSLYEKECLVYGGPRSWQVTNAGQEQETELELTFPHTNAAIARFF